MLLPALDWFLVVVLLLNLVALGVSRLRAVIQAVAVQGGLLGIMALIVHQEFGVRVVLVATATVAVKAVVIPRLLFYAMREVAVRHEVEPFVGFLPSLLLGAVGTGLALAFARTLPLRHEQLGTLLVPASFATVFTGFLILTTRRKAISQAVGYLVLENGVFLFGLLLLEALPFLVEMGVLLDLLAGIFVMGIIIHHVNREFASMSTDYLSALKE
jgi:hydrogenase-4 component E